MALVRELSVGWSARGCCTNASTSQATATAVSPAQAPTPVVEADRRCGRRLALPAALAATAEKRIAAVADLENGWRETTHQA